MDGGNLNEREFKAWPEALSPEKQPENRGGGRGQWGGGGMTRSEIIFQIFCVGSAADRTSLPLYYDYTVPCERHLRLRPRPPRLAGIGAAGKDSAGYAQAGARRAGPLGSLLLVAEPATPARMGTGSDLQHRGLLSWSRRGPHPGRRSRTAGVAP
jgi:hypothetical protein